jgi:carbonic anhydrase
MQSPIDIVSTKSKALGKFDFYYNAHSLQMSHIGINVLVQGECDSKLVFSGETYTLQQYHFHHPAEHTIDGKEYSMEFHLVHMNSAQELLVIGIMMEISAEDNPYFELIFANFPQNEGDSFNDSTIMIHPADFLPEGTENFYHYMGSLTTPPCSENVRWFLLAESITVSQKQIDAFTKVFAKNNRPLQDLNEREIFHQSS